ncbi:MAG: outer membrane protein OmpA-like peptidoglycan-associated protein [Candidatus Azotimanducaceae bacterium]|jgi:outer membrane protein OmpA-like peptidoglycan-associated protein
MIRFAFPLISALILLAGSVFAVELNLPENSRKTLQRDNKLDSYSAPIGPFQNGKLQTQTIEGKVNRSAWRVGSSGVTTLQILAPLRDQLLANGYTKVLDCDQTTCGGFDFRFGTEVLPAPEMYVNIRAFRFLTAVKGETAAPSEVVSLLVSTSGVAGYVQVIQAGQIDGRVVRVETQAAVPTAQQSEITIKTSLDESLLGTGSVVLSGLNFATGTSDLGKGPFPVLKELAAFFTTRDDIQLVLVGHTDSDGALDFNIALSKRRAASVRKRLLEAYGLDGDRITAEGNGYLAPIRSNLESAGRTANRRVEAVVLPLQ